VEIVFNGETHEVTENARFELEIFGNKWAVNLVDNKNINAGKDYLGKEIFETYDLAFDREQELYNIYNL